VPPERNQREFDQRNYLLNLADGLLFAASSAFLSLQIVLPALVVRLGGGNMTVGLLPLIVYAGLFLPQIFAARYVETLPWKKPWALQGGLVQRLAVLLIGVMVFTFAENSPGVALAGLLLLYLSMQMFSGITTPGWYDLFAKVTPLRKRGRLAGQRTSLGSLAAFLCGILLTILLGSYGFPNGYVLGFGVAFVLQSFSLLAQSFVVEAEPSVTLVRRSVGEYLKGLRDIFQTNAEFRRFIVSASCLTIANMPVGFFTVYALRRFSADESIVGEFTLAMMSAQVVSATITGLVADRHGNKVALVIAASGTLLATVWALLAPSAGWFRLVFLFLGFNVGSELMTRYNMSAEYAPVEQRSSYVALMNTLLAPYYVSALIGGWISDRFGFSALFAVSLLFSVIGIILLVGRVREPRLLAGGRMTEG
jgi:MFS family permease